MSTRLTDDHAALGMFHFDISDISDANQREGIVKQKLHGLRGERERKCLVDCGMISGGPVVEPFSFFFFVIL